MVQVSPYVIPGSILLELATPIGSTCNYNYIRVDADRSTFCFKTSVAM